ncbi:MAG: acyl transferase [Spirosomataceae bacterium]
MLFSDELKSAVLQLNSQTPSPQWEDLALEIFQYQASQNQIYKEYLQHLGVSPTKIRRVDKIPCLPIQFFKEHTIVCQGIHPIHVFESSGTTGTQTSRHFIADLAFYEALSLKIFEQFYGALTDYHILALLPSYLERNNSSLVYMVQHFISRSFSTASGFYLEERRALMHQLRRLLEDTSSQSRKVILWGVTFALLDLLSEFPAEDWLIENTHRLILMETGGMKGRRKEMIREEVHQTLRSAWPVQSIHSEYGMTELLSQGYSLGDGWFHTPPSMRIYLREINDPFHYLPRQRIGQETHARRGKTGGINVIDLGNVDSCCFIETQDLGSYSPDYHQFQVLGRFDQSDIRGCNLLILH